jgi:hypothetical protein
MRRKRSFSSMRDRMTHAPASGVSIIPSAGRFGRSGDSLRRGGNKVGDIRLYFASICIWSAKDYEEVKRNVEARIMAGVADAGDRALATLLVDLEGRYYEAKAEEAA